MPLDFHCITDVKREVVLYSLSHTRLQEMADGMARFERKTGIFVDEYGSTRLGGTSLALLADCVEEIDPEFATFLKDNAQQGRDLMVEGD